MSEARKTVTAENQPITEAQLQTLDEAKHYPEWTEFDGDLKKKAFIIAYSKSFGNITASCAAVKCSRQTFYNWMQADAAFKKAIEEVEPDERLMDMIQTQLYQKALVDKDITALIFIAKTKGKSRGFIERTENMNLNIDAPLVIDWTREKGNEDNTANPQATESLGSGQNT